MKILLLQEGGVHEKNKHLRECITLQKGLLNIGHECDVWGKNHPHCDITKLPDFDSYDLVVDLWEAYHEHLDLSSVKTKKFLWSCDAHVQGEKYYTDLMEKGKYDAILSNAKGLFEDVPSFWFKPSIDTDYIKRKDIKKEHFIGFCGNRNPERNDFIDRLTNIYSMKQDIFVIGNDMVDAINSYQIHFNKNLGEPHGFSGRVAETLACGTLLLTNSSYMHEDLGLVNRKNCLIYETFDDIINELEWVKEGDRIKTLSDNGHKLYHQFSSEDRAKDLINYAS
jgi:hypothetical protein